jgi:hypothetical protein
MQDSAMVISTTAVTFQTTSRLTGGPCPCRLRTVLVIDHIGEYSRANTWIFSFYLRLAKFLRTCKEEKVRSDDQEKEDVDGARKVEHDNAKEGGRRRHVLVTEQ